jgi:hypothetical protein
MSLESILMTNARRNSTHNSATAIVTARGRARGGSSVSYTTAFGGA